MERRSADSEGGRRRCQAFGENRKEWAKHWRCDTKVQGLKHKPWPWRNEELNNLEQDLPRLRESDLEKASRSYKAKTGVGCGAKSCCWSCAFCGFLSLSCLCVQVSARLLLACVVVAGSPLLQLSFALFQHSDILFSCFSAVAWSNCTRTQSRLQTPPTLHLWVLTLPDTDTVLDSAYQEASRSLAALLQPRKRDGTEMADAGGTGVAACNPTASDPGANSLSGRLTSMRRRRAALEHSCKRRKESNFTVEFMEGAAQKAVQCHVTISIATTTLDR